VSSSKRRIAAWVGVVVLQLVLLEGALWLATSMGWLAIGRPSYGGSSFWDGSHTIFGVWHREDAETRHRSACFDVAYKTNAVGARDRERAVRTQERRIVVLGDSFAEGWGVHLPERIPGLSR
jgi:hypothetical protein